MQVVVGADRRIGWWRGIGFLLEIENGFNYEQRNTIKQPLLVKPLHTHFIYLRHMQILLPKTNLGSSSLQTISF